MLPWIVENVDHDALVNDAGFWSLYEASFPTAEREPADVVLRSLEMGVGVVLRARVDGLTIGLVTLQVLRDPPAVFLVYLAVDPERRSAGLGRALFERGWEEGVARSGGPPLAMVWEVDRPGEQNRDSCERRVRFFQRLGGRVISREYVQPPVDGVTAVPMWLMARPGDWDRADVARFVRAVYFEKYDAVNGVPAVLLQSLLGQSGV